MAFLTLFLPFLLLRSLHALEVTQNSECSSLCLTDRTANSTHPASSTQNYQLVCDDWELSGPNATGDGIWFHDCVSCQSNSTAFDKKTNENDVYWFLFNMKYTLSWCLFNYEQNNATTQSRQCGDTCAGPQGAMRIAMTDRLLQTNATVQYQYCEGEEGAFEKNVDECVSCLQEVPSSMALVNYLRAMKAGCEQRPKPGDDTTIALPFELYDLKSVNSSATSEAAGPASSSPAPTVTVTSVPTPSSSSSTPSPALKFGLGLGLGLGIPLLLAAAAAAALLFLRYRRQRQHAQSQLEHQNQYHQQAQEVGGAPRQHRTEMQATTNPTHLYAEADDGKRPPEADDGKPPVPEKDRWLVGAGAGRQESQGHSFGDLPLYERNVRESRGGRGELDGAGGR